MKTSNLLLILLFLFVPGVVFASTEISGKMASSWQDKQDKIKKILSSSKISKSKMGIYIALDPSESGRIFALNEFKKIIPA